MLLSIGMMIKNEEKYLRECLQSLTPLLDSTESELVIIDTGSTDDSINIARCFTDKVFFHSWNDNFSDMRNKVISYCTGEWLMVIDGDEVLQNPTEIIKFIKSNDSKKFNTALLMIKNLTDEKDLSNFSLINAPRLFRRDKEFHYEGVVHNQPVFKQPITKINSSLIHYGYIASDKGLMEKKFMRTVSLLRKELEKDPLNFYYLYQLSVSYAMHNEYDKALLYIVKAYEIIKNKGLLSGEYIYIYMQLAYSYMMNKEYKKVIDICLEGIALKSGIIDLYFCLAKAQMMTKDYKNAVKNYKEYLNISENISEFTSTNLTLYTLGRDEYAYYDLVISLIETEDYEEAFEYCKKITEEQLITANLTNVIFLSLKTKCYDYLYQFYSKHVVRLNLQSSFENTIENVLKDLLHEDRFEIAKVLKQIDSLYGVLNKIRCSIFEKEELSFEINNYLELHVDFNKLKDYYGDFLYYLILHKKDICRLLSNVRELDFNRFFIYLNERYNDFGKTIFLYLQEVNFCEKKSSYRIKKALERYSILTDQLNEEDFVKIFKLYLEDGTKYISEVYSKSIFLNEDIYELKNEEEGFLLYMSKAILTKDSDKKSYIEYLRKALKTFPYMRRGIEYLLKEFNDDKNVQNDELEQYKIQVKSTINSLIENNRLEDAKALISEYRKIIPNDIEIYSINAVVLIKEERLSEAEEVLKDGLFKDNTNFDILYKLGYLYEKENNITEALAVYNIARITCDNAEFKKLVEERIIDLGKKIK